MIQDGVAAFLALCLSIGCVWAQDSAELLHAQAEREFQQSDAKLRLAYDQLVAELDVAQRKEFTALHEQWLAFRDASAINTAALASPTANHLKLFKFLELNKLTQDRLAALDRIQTARRTYAKTPEK